VALLVTARLLGPLEFGIAMTALAVVQLVNLLVEHLFAEALVQCAEPRQEHFDTAFWTCFTLAVALAVVAWLGADLVTAVYGQRDVGLILAVMALGLPFAAYTGVQTASLRRAMQFHQLALRTLFARTTGIVAAVSLAFAGAGVWALVVQYLAATVLGAVALWYVSSQRIGFRLCRCALRDMLGFACACIARELLHVGHSRIFQLLASGLLGARDFAFFGLAFRLVDTLREVIGHTASNVSLPVFARLQHDREELAKQFVTATCVTCAIAAPLFAGLAASATPVVSFILGDAWLSVVPVMQVLAVGTAIASAATFCFSALQALRRPALDVPRALFDIVASTSLLLIFSGQGLVAIAAVWAGSRVLSAGIGLGLCLRVLPLRVGQFVAAIWPAALLSVVAAIALGGAVHMLRPHLGPGAQLVLLIPAGAALVVLGILLLHRDLAMIALDGLRGKAVSQGASQ
jgi:PST family polysaccharide transporter